MCVVVPVQFADDKELRFAKGLVANIVYLLQVKSCFVFFVGRRKNLPSPKKPCDELPFRQGPGRENTLEWCGL